MAVNDEVDIMRQLGTSEEDCANALNDLIKKQAIKVRIEQMRTNVKDVEVENY